DYQRALEALARAATMSKNYKSAVDLWRRLALSDPLSSRFALEVIQGLSDAGDRVAAVQYARAFQQLVRSELGVDPDPAIDELVAQLSQRDAIVPPSRGIHSVSENVSETVLDGPAVRRGTHTSATVRLGDGDSAAADESRGRFRSRSWAWTGLTIVLAVVVLAIANATGGAPKSDARAAPARHASRSPDARARMFYLRGVSSWSDRSKEGLDTAVIYFRRATEIDPLYAEAYAGLANAYVLLGYSGYRPGDAMFPKAKAEALRAIELDSTLASPHAALGHELMWERDFQRSESEFKKAIALDPGYATAHQWYGMLLMILGQTKEAVAETGRAAALDPLSLQVQNTYGTFLGASGQPAAALRHYERVVGQEPDSAWIERNPWLLTNMASMYAANGIYDKAIHTAKLALRVVPNHPRAVTTMASIYLRMGKRAQARRIFESADTSNEHYAVYRGMMHARLGDADSAFMWFDKVREWPIPAMISLRDDGGLRAIRKDPRYAALLRRLGLQP
ncbi:MAG: tetratricopeptide repeat protein, partial [Gemmatimonadaceae bacterium]